MNLEKQYGRAIIVTDSKFEAKTYFETFAQGRLGDVEPALGDDSLSHHALNLVASGLCRTPEQVRSLLLASYTGEMLWRGGNREKDFDQRLAAGLKRCIDGKLIEPQAEKLAATELGRLTAVKGISVETAIQLASYAAQNRAHAGDIHILELILCLAKTEDGEDVHFNLSTTEFQSNRYLEQLKGILAGMSEGARGRLSCITNLSTLSYERAKRAKKALILFHWVTGTPTREIESRFNCLAGAIVGLATEFSWLAEAFSSVCKLASWPEEVTARVKALSEQLVFGVPAAGVEVVAARVPGLGRARAVLLLNAGVDTLEKALAIPQASLDKLLTKQVAARFLAKAKWILDRKAQQPQGSEPFGCAEYLDQEDLAEWLDTYPFSDEMGTAYRSDAMIHIDGRSSRRRYLVTLNKKDAWLSERSFSVMLELLVAAKTSELGWMPFERLGTHETYHQVVRRLKKDLQAGEVDPDLLIENNRSKQYRLSVPPEHITFDPEMIVRHFPEAKRLIDLLNNRK